MESNEENNPLFNIAQLGVEMEEFILSKVGRHLIGEAQTLVAVFKDWVMDHPLPESKEFQRRHMQAMAAEMLLRSIGSACIDGKEAVRQLEENTYDGFIDGPVGPYEDDQ